MSREAEMPIEAACRYVTEEEAKIAELKRIGQRAAGGRSTVNAKRDLAATERQHNCSLALFRRRTSGPTAG